MDLASAAKPHPPLAPAPGILLINSGTPQSPTPADLREYHAEFLSDPRVIDWPRWIWLPLLHGIILRSRPRKVAQKYREIWTERGSPLLSTMEEIQSSLEDKLRDEFGSTANVGIGMRYGHPSIGEGLRGLRAKGASRIILLPLFPQYSKVTTASAHDAVLEELATWSNTPEIRTIDDYYNHPAYVRALKESIFDFWQENGESDQLLFSYHGIPQSYARNGDPYGQQCLETTRLVSNLLDCQQTEIQTSFQSRFGPQEWLKPYTDELLHNFAGNGTSLVDVLCPGFAADCLETLHEIGIEARDDFYRWGGQELRYIPALNAAPAHIGALMEILTPNLSNPIPSELGQQSEHREQ